MINFQTILLMIMSSQGRLKSLCQALLYNNWDETIHRCLEQHIIIIYMYEHIREITLILAMFTMFNITQIFILLNNFSLNANDIFNAILRICFLNISYLGDVRLTTLKYFSVSMFLFLA